MRVAVLGAGPAGLGAAYRCARDGHEVTLLEARPRVGGLAASITIAGRRVDLGSHRLHPTCAPEILADLRRFLGDDLRARPRRGRIRLGDRWVAFPLRPADALAHLPRPLALGLARDLAGGFRRPRLRGPGDGARSYADALVARFGPTACEWVWFPYARKLWGLEPGEISARQAEVRVGTPSLWSAVARALRPVVRGPARFWYPRGGFGRISESLAAAAAATGADIKLSTPVTALGFGGDAPVTVRGGGDCTGADLVLSTLPLGTLPGLTEASTPEVREAAAGLEHRAMILVYLVFGADTVTGFDAHYLPDCTVATARVSEPRHYGGDWPPGRTILCCEVPCTEGDTLWTRPDADVAAAVEADLETSGIGTPGAASEAHVVRLRRVYPVYRRGHESAADTVAAWARSLDGVVTLGRQGLFLHDNTHQAIAMGYAAAACTGTDSFDTAAWTRDLDRFASNVVED